MRYGRRLGCKYGMPHDPQIVHENERVKWEVCQICNQKFRWNKDSKGRIANNEYLKVHVRSFAQQGGATRRVYNLIYRPEKCVIIL